MKEEGRRHRMWGHVGHKFERSSTSVLQSLDHHHRDRHLLHNDRVLWGRNKVLQHGRRAAVASLPNW